MEASPPTIGSKTTILGLNDDCLREVFDHMHLQDLAAIANVCSRFRQNAAESARSKFKKITLSENREKHDYTLLRYFGASVESVCVYGSQTEWYKRVMELLSRYCVGKSIKLSIHRFDMTDEIAHHMEPLLGRVINLEFERCKFDEVLLLKNLPLWSTELRQLAFTSCNMSSFEVMGTACSHQKFSKLELIRLSNLKGVKNQDITKFLKHNPQLKRIEVKRCPQLDDFIFQSIAKYVPNVEEINVALDEPINANYIKYFGQLRKLKSLDIDLDGNQMYTHLVLHEIVSANIALEFLNLSDFKFDDNICGAISKLQKLKSLQSQFVKNMTASRLIEMCKPLEYLSEIVLHFSDCQMTKDDLLSIIQNLGKLQKFDYCSSAKYKALKRPYHTCINIDVGTFKKMVEIVKRRTEKTPLTLCLDKHGFTADLPRELIGAASNLLSLIIE